MARAARTTCIHIVIDMVEVERVNYAQNVLGPIVSP